eukprot:7069476-Prymnesium_polylepis.1
MTVNPRALWLWLTSDITPLKYYRTWHIGGRDRREARRPCWWCLVRRNNGRTATAVSPKPYQVPYESLSVQRSRCACARPASVGRVYCGLKANALGNVWACACSPLRELIVLEELAANLPAVVVDV